MSLANSTENPSETPLSSWKAELFEQRRLRVLRDPGLVKNKNQSKMKKRFYHFFPPHFFSPHFFFIKGFFHYFSPHFFPTRAVLTNSPNSCPPERLFSIFNATYNDDQKSSYTDYIELLSQFNKPDL